MITPLEPAFILHRYPYRNTSLIVVFFSREYGRFSAIARAARGPKSRFKGQLEPFTPLLISFKGREALKSLQTFELNGSPIWLDQSALSSGFYLNELLFKLLPSEDAHPALFDLYQQTLQALAQKSPIEPTLRIFEKHLLQMLGYGLPLHQESEANRPIEASKQYYFLPERGFLACNTPHAQSISGECLLSLAQETFPNSGILKEAKRLMQQVFHYHLGKKGLNSRMLFCGTPTPVHDLKFS